MLVAELFSGIGGMHFALKESGIPSKVVLAADINNVANNVYSHNFPGTNVLQMNIENICIDTFNKLVPEMLLMSPPCQPFTRNGLGGDIFDNRAGPLIHITKVIKRLSSIKYVLVENVTGFDKSEARDHLVASLEASGFTCAEFLLSPLQFGIPNSRQRYYLLAKRRHLPFIFKLQPTLMTELPEVDGMDLKGNKKIDCIDDILEIRDMDSEEYKAVMLTEKELKKGCRVIDIVTPKSQKSCCFTKAYTHYLDGTGSVLCLLDETAIRDSFQDIKHSDNIEDIKALKLRYFTPTEVARLMCFPSNFNFPPQVTNRQKYKLLGNSINIHVVSILIKLLCI